MCKIIIKICILYLPANSLELTPPPSESATLARSRLRSAESLVFSISNSEIRC